MGYGQQGGKLDQALAGVGQWTELRPVNQRVTVRFPVRRMPGLWARSWAGVAGAGGVQQASTL